MRIWPLPATLLFSSVVLAKPWNGIEPGASHREDVVKKFGEPAKRVNLEGKEILAYVGPQAIKGTTETQFRIDSASRVVERIDVFPGPTVDKDTVESTYGPPCPSGPPPAAPCYVKKLTDEFQTYFLYPKLGLAVFLKEDAKTVHSFVFEVQKTPR